jgi:hypothetical protein
MKGDKECEEYQCKALPYCTWNPDECIGARLSIKKDNLTVLEMQKLVEKMLGMIDDKNRGGWD